MNDIHRPSFEPFDINVRRGVKVNNKNAIDIKSRATKKTRVGRSQELREFHRKYQNEAE